MIHELLRSALRAAVPAGAGAIIEVSGAADDVGNRTATVAQARDRLRNARVALDHARRSADDASAALERVRGIISDADLARDEADRAETAAAAVTKAWAEAGAPADRSASDPELLERSATAARRRDDARTMADGAEAALPRLQEAHSDAIRAVQIATADHLAAVQKLLFVTAESDFAELDRMRAVSAAPLLRIRALAHALRYGKVHGIPAFGWSEIQERLSDLTPPKSTDEELRVAASYWIDLAKRLLKDPEAQV